jgi:hypothetical protein
MPGFKVKTIKNIIERKINQWLDTIEDAEVKDLATENTIVTGGSITSMLLGEDINDFDLYFRTHEAALRIAEYYVSRFKSDQDKTDINVQDTDGRIKIIVKSNGVASELGTNIISDTDHIEITYQEIEEKALKTEGGKSYKPIFLTTNAITLSDKIQLIVRFYGEPDQIHENYDFVHCTCYWTSWDNKLVLRPEALEAILAKELRYIGSKYPVCSVVRLRKFIQRGWRINAGQIVKMSMQISELDLTNIEVLEDQLTGVDTAYFSEVISKLRDKNPDKIDSAYLIEIIDRIF